MLVPLGHHASTCKRGRDVVFRHNILRIIVAESCRLAHLSVKVEAGNDLTPDHSHTSQLLSLSRTGPEAGQQLLTSA